MTDAEKADLSQFKGEARQRVATQVGWRWRQLRAQSAPSINPSLALTAVACRL